MTSPDPWESAAKYFLDDSIEQFHKMKSLAEKAMSQVSDDEFFKILDPESNSIALTVKHIAGNLKSRWTDFLTSDGEKEWRVRDSEFVIESENTRQGLLESWEQGWKCLFDAVTPLTGEDLTRIVEIRGEPHAVVKAINRQLTHYSYHIGQIVFLAKHLKSQDWKNLSVPRGKSDEFHKQVRSEAESRPESKDRGVLGRVGVPL